MIRYLRALAVGSFSAAGVLLADSLTGAPHPWRGAAIAAVFGFVVAGFHAWATRGDRDA